MGDEIKQPQHIGQVLPTKRTRDTAQHKRPRPSSGEVKDKSGRRPPAGDSAHRVDEYA